MSKLSNTLARLQIHASKPWYAPLVSISATLDYFILASPAQSLFITTVLLNPARRVYAALCFSLAAAFGAMLLAASVQFVDASMASVVAEFNNGAPSAYWQKMQIWMDKWGPLTLLVLSVIPVPLRTSVILAALAGIPFLIVGCMVLLGRLLSLIIIGQIVYQTPQFLLSFSFVRRLVERFKTTPVTQGRSQLQGPG